MRWTACIALALIAFSATSASALTATSHKRALAGPPSSISRGRSHRSSTLGGYARRGRTTHSAVFHTTAGRRTTAARLHPAVIRGRYRSRRAAAVSAGQAMMTTSFSVSRLAMPAPLRGSRESLTRQNEMSEAEGLERIEDEDDLADRIAHNLLIAVPVSAALSINTNLPENHRYCRPWTATFLADIARVHAVAFHHPLQVSSAVRTVEYQKHLMGINGNAAAAEGDVVSPHLTGATIDIAKTGMSRQEMAWMRNWLLPLEAAGKIDVEEEFKQACFHITVYKNYEADPTLPKPVEAKTPQHRPAENKAVPTLADAPA